MKHFKAIASFRSLGEILIGAGLVVDRIMPSITVTGSDIIIYRVTMIYSQM